MAKTPLDDDEPTQEEVPVEPLDGQVPAPRRAALPRRRRPASSPVELPFAIPAEDGPRVADLSALLGDIDALRLTLQTDLTLAAAALEADAAGLAAELVDSDLAELRAFGGRAAHRLAGLDAGETEVEVEQPADETPAPVAMPRRRILSAAPLMAAAAALIGFVAFVPDRGGLQSPDTTMTSAAMAGWELNRLAREGAPDEALRLAAMELNDELAELIAQAATDPAAAQQALMLLDSTTQVLAGEDETGVLRDVLAEARALRERLQETLPTVAQRASRPTRTVVRAVPTTLPRFERQQPERQQTSSAPASAKPTASPKPSPSAAPTSPPPAPSPQPSSPSPTPSEDDEGPLSGTDGLPGF